MRNRFFVVILSALAFPLLAQQDFSQMQIKTTKVAGSVYMLEGGGGNIGVSVGEDGIILIDDQYAPLAPKIEAALRAISDKPVRFVLNTHWHGDHTGGNENFGKQAPIIAHTNVRKRLAQGRNEPGFETPPAPNAALPVITFDDRLMVHINGEDVRAIHYPKGHTDGDSVIFFTKSNVVHMGDDFFNGRFPFIDLGSGGSVRGLIRNVDAVIGMVPADVKVIPGHGPLATLSDLKSFSAMLKDSLKIVEGQMKKGRTLAQMKSDKVLAKYESLSWQFINTDTFTETLFQSLTAESKAKKPGK